LPLPSPIPADSCQGPPNPGLLTTVGNRTAPLSPQADKRPSLPKAGSQGNKAPKGMKWAANSSQDQDRHADPIRELGTGLNRDGDGVRAAGNAKRLPPRHDLGGDPDRSQSSFPDSNGISKSCPASPIQSLRVQYSEIRRNTGRVCGTVVP